MSVVPENAGRPESWLRLREAFLQEHQIGLRATGERPDDALPGWRRLQVSWRGLNHAVWVDDEYGDLSADAPLLSSEVLLRSLCDYADHASAAAWIKTNGRGIAPALASGARRISAPRAPKFARGCPEESLDTQQACRRAARTPVSAIIDSGD